jgi:glycosyltransferase involved in cell wall biosynthesis
MRSASALLATAGAEQANLSMFFPSSRIEVLSLGIEPDVRPNYEHARRELGWKDHEKVLLYLSRVHPKKGLLELLQALLSLPQESLRGKARLVILGDGPEDYTEACRQLTNRLSGTIEVEWHPPQWGDAKWKYLQGADVFCLPTWSENFGIVVLEAGIVGTPVFTTTGTPWKVVEEAGFGWVVDPDPAAYPAVISEILALPHNDLKAMRGPFAEWTRRNYAWPSLVGHYRDFYASIINGAANEPKRN